MSVFTVSLLPCKNPFFPISLEEPPDPTREQKPKMVFYKPKVTISDDTVTSAVHLTLKVPDTMFSR